MLPLTLFVLSFIANPSFATADLSRLDLPDDPYEAVVEKSARVDRREFAVRFPSPVATVFPPNNTVWAHLSLPPGPGPFPCVLVLPVMAAPNIWIERRFINRFEKDGFAVLWLEMPYQFNRRAHPSAPSGQGFLARSAPRLAFNFRQSALDARRALEWLSRRPEIDGRRIGVFGISLGAMVGAAVYSVDATPGFAVLMLGGADFPTLAATSSMTGPFLRSAGIKPEELRGPWRGIDPLDYRAANRDKPILLINARSDDVIPMASALRLKDAFPKAEQFWVPLGHYTAILHLIWIPRYISSRMDAGLKTQ